MLKKRLIRIGLITALILGTALLVGILGPDQNVSVVQKTASISPMAGAAVGGPFTLVDHTSKTVTQDEYAGDYKLIYFGFTYCPAICPTELQKMSKALDILEENGTDTSHIQPLFITVDPERDTVEVMREYVTLFHPRLVGLTGSVEQIEAVKKTYRVYSAKIEDPELSDYTVDHSSFIYLMSPDNQLITVYSTEDKPKEITNDLVDKIAF